MKRTSSAISPEPLTDAAEWTVTTLWRDEDYRPFDIVAIREGYVVAEIGCLVLLDRSGRELRRRALDSTLSLARWGDSTAVLTWRGVFVVDEETLATRMHTPVEPLDRAEILQVTADSKGYFIGSTPVLVSTPGRPLILDRQHSVLYDISQTPEPLLDIRQHIPHGEVLHDALVEGDDVIVSTIRGEDLIGIAGTHVGSLMPGFGQSITRFVRFGQALVGIAGSKIVLVRDGVVSVIAGRDPDDRVDGPGDRARFYLPGARGLLVEGETILVTDTLNDALRVIRRK